MEDTVCPCFIHIVHIVLFQSQLQLGINTVKVLAFSVHLIFPFNDIILGKLGKEAYIGKCIALLLYF